MEIDSHADTTCFGSNFTPISFTGQSCDVTPFSDTYKAMEEIPVASAATAWDDPNAGHTIILQFHQGLWFGDGLENSLINPNQCRMNGIDLCDDPFDPHRKLGIRDPETDNEIPLEFREAIVGVQTRAPTIDEIATLPTITMTDEQPWDPSKIGKRRSSKEEEEKTVLVAGLSVKAVGRTGTPNWELPKREREEAETDVLMASCSEAYHDGLMVQRLVSSVKVASYMDEEEPEEEIECMGAEGGIRVAATSSERHSEVTAQEVARKFGCGMETAQKTLKATTQRGIRHAVHPLSRRYRTDILQSSLRRLNAKFYGDAMFSKTKSLRGNTSGMIFTNGRFTHVEPMKSKAEAGDALNSFMQDVGVPEMLVFDGAAEQTGPRTEFMKSVRRNHINWHNTEPHSGWQNRAEDEIREIRKKWRALKARKNVPGRLWDYTVVHLSKLTTLTARGTEGRTPYEEVTGETPDISEYLDFEFYDWVWYWDMPGDEDNPKIGRWLGVSHRIGSAMTFYILAESGQVVSRSTVQHLTRTESMKEEIKKRCDEYEKAIAVKMDDENYTIQHQEENAFYIEDKDASDDEMEFVEKSERPEIEDVTPDTYDELIGAQVMLPDGDGRLQGRVTKRAKTEHGTPIGTRNENIFHDTRKYEVELSDGTTQEYHANVIAENLFSQVDSEGRQYLLMKELTNHKRDESALHMSDGWMTTRTGRRVRKKTTKGWKLLVEWKEGSSDWIPLKQLKEAYPVEVAEYARANKIDMEPAFAWWVKDVLRKRNRLISKVKSRYWKTTHKFGIELPHSVEEAYVIDKKTGTDFWRKAIEKEMSKIRSMGAFERYDKAKAKELREGKAKLPGFQEISCHMVFDIKMDGKFTRKARFVANGRLTKDVPASNTYASVVSRESVRIAFLYASLNDLDVLGCDVSNAYLNADCRERIWIEGGKEFGSEAGMVFIIKKALYGLKTSGFSWRMKLSQTLEDMGYKPSIADPDVYLRPASTPAGFEYYEMVLTYVDDCLCVSDNPKETMDALGKLYDLKDTVKRPDRYLGANIGRWQLPDGREVWSMEGLDYVKNGVAIVKEMLAGEGRALRAGRSTDRPMPKSYKPEMDVSPALGSELASRYQQLIGILRWAVELGRVDIMLEVAILSSHLCLPREGHLEAAYSIFAYLDKHVNAPMAFDPYRPKLNEDAFNVTDWSESIYGDVEEELPPQRPKPRGNPVSITCFVDANHAGDVITRRSQTGFIIYINNAPIDWYSKKQNTVESSTFGSEFVALRIATERIKALRYKLRMFGIPIDGPTNVLGDNESVVNSASKVEARLNKKHNAICFHTVREASAAKWIRVGWEPTGSNVADLFTKMLETGQRRKLLRSIYVKGSLIAEGPCDQA